MNEYFAVTAPGIAPYTAQELGRLRLFAPGARLRRQRRSRTEDASGDLQGGVTFAGDKAALYRANLHLRTANRVLARLGHFEAVGFTELRKRAARLPWEAYLAPGQPVALRVTCHKSRLYHSDAVAQRVAGAIADRLGVEPSLRKFDEEGEGEGPQLIVVRLLHDQCTISVDASGELLHRRGYRLATAKAPLRETLAAAMLMAGGWAPAKGQAPAPLLDPFCGSGTIVIEAAQMALGIAPGMGSGRPRRYAFMSWPDFDPTLWEEVVAEAQERQQDAALGVLPIVGSDRDAGAVEAAHANASRAGVAAHVEFSRQPVSAAASRHSRGWIVTNPPYGIRIGPGSDLRNLFAEFGRVLRSTFGGWQLAVLCNDRRLLGQLGLPLTTDIHLFNGGVAVVLACGEVPFPGAG